MCWAPPSSVSNWPTHLTFGPEGAAAKQVNRLAGIGCFPGSVHFHHYHDVLFHHAIYTRFDWSWRQSVVGRYCTHDPPSPDPLTSWVSRSMQGPSREQPEASRTTSTLLSVSTPSACRSVPGHAPASVKATGKCLLPSLAHTPVSPGPAWAYVLWCGPCPPPGKPCTCQSRSGCGPATRCSTGP